MKAEVQFTKRMQKLTVTGTVSGVTLDGTPRRCYGAAVIRSFRDPDTQALYEGRRVRRFDRIAAQAERRLNLLDTATVVRDLAGLPSNRLEALKGDRKGQYSRAYAQL